MHSNLEQFVHIWEFSLIFYFHCLYFIIDKDQYFLFISEDNGTWSLLSISIIVSYLQPNSTLLDICLQPDLLEIVSDIKRWSDFSYLFFPMMATEHSLYYLHCACTEQLLVSHAYLSCIDLFECNTLLSELASTAQNEFHTHFLMDITLLLWSVNE